MRAALAATIAFCTLALIAPDLHAGAVLQTVERELPDGKDGDVTTLQVNDGMVRIETLEVGAKAPTSGVIFKNETLTALDHKKKTYTVIDRATLQQLGARVNSAMKQMEAQLAQMSPEQRAMVEKMMGNSMPSGQKTKHVAPVFTRTARSERIGGHTCQVWEGKRDGVKTSEVCVTPYGSVAGGEELVEAMKGMTSMMEELYESMDSPWIKDMISDEWEAVSRIDGYPVVTRTFTDGKADSEHALKAARSESVATAVFEVPPGYKRKDLDSVTD